ncbi:MAG: Ku protein [Deltaproteobacteria bacterium]|nr:MAG: Ku protein [Deltaproteobacteria bacterium]
MRAIWKGYLRCALVTVPVKLYSAVRDHSIQFSLLHKECGTKIKQQKVCPTCGRAVSNEELVRGYQYGKDRWIIVTDEEIEKAKKESSDVMEIVRFVEAEAIPPVFFADSHYLVPDGEVALEAFALFHRGMKETNKVAIAKVVMRNRERLLVLRPYHGAMLSLTLHYADEVRDLGEVGDLEKVEKVKVDSSVLDMVKLLIESLSGEFAPEEFRDEYTETLLQIIKAKAEGEQIEVKPREETKKVVDFMEALRQSLMATGVEIPRKGVAQAGKGRKVERKRAKKS